MRVWAACSTKVLFCAPVISSFTYRYYRGLFVWKHKRKSGLCPIMKPPPAGKYHFSSDYCKHRGLWWFSFHLDCLHAQSCQQSENVTDGLYGARDTIASKSKNFLAKKAKNWVLLDLTSVSWGSVPLCSCRQQTSCSDRPTYRCGKKTKFCFGQFLLFKEVNLCIWTNSL